MIRGACGAENGLEAAGVDDEGGSIPAAATET